MDVIARCAFGMSIENLGSDDDPFMKNAKNVFSTPVSKNPFILIPCKFEKSNLALVSTVYQQSCFCQ